MPYISFVRHAETDQNHDPICIGGRSNHLELRDRGHIQGELLAVRLASEGCKADAIYVSPAVRTIATAGYVKKGVGYTGDLVIDDRLQELHQGERTGKNRKDIYSPEVVAQFHAKPRDTGAPGGETIRQTAQRMNECVDEIVATYTDPNSHIWIVSHGVAIAAMVMQRFGMTDTRIKMFPHANTGITTLYYDANNPVEKRKLLTYSDAGHLIGEMKSYQLV